MIVPSNIIQCQSGIYFLVMIWLCYPQLAIGRGIHALSVFDLPNITNKSGKKIGLNRMLMVCYRRPLNLGNLLSYRRLTFTNGPPVSSYRIRQQVGPVRETERVRDRPSNRENKNDDAQIVVRPRPQPATTQNPLARCGFTPLVGTD
jgi:hypothetical protein